MVDVPAVPPALAKPVANFLASRAQVRAVTTEFGSPVHLVFPEVFRDNLARLRGVLDAAPMRYRILYAHKVNQAAAFVQAAREEGIGIDVASLPELRSALAAGFSSDQIEATGPKGAAFLGELVSRGALISVDNLWELAFLVDSGVPVAVLLRVSGFTASAPSRFGIDLAEVPAALLRVAESRVMLRGFAFHLDSESMSERVRAIGECLPLFELAYARGLSPTVLNIGGGLRQVFGADPFAFDTYDAALRAGFAGTGPRMQWATSTFGYTREGTGTPVFHKYANTVPARTMLADLLATPLPDHDGRSVATVLADNLLELWLEPGKSLVDGAGITLATVEFVKTLANGDVMVHLDLSRDTVTAADQEILLDPIILGQPAPTEAGVGVFFAGHLCLERDVITRRRVRVHAVPDPGDIVVFANTAAYHMDLSAAHAAMHPRVPKLVVHEDHSVTPDAVEIGHLS
ncbi:decarboxylase [Nocardia camponoti]|uniref:Diaminopimelate decarboxylase n=1 Tax=Nocardia camponoti TaxID=1616106 RepID=A0A917Q822_9NOCA|nr:decarboxylase [Nocardia camponoti]GGK34872.1 diaminopimelate decarboxylase [Nocardia camponoti]